MALWFYRGLRRGIATTRYPQTIDPWAHALPGPPAFHSSRLTTALADRLVRECASRALSRDDHELVLDAGRCTGCGLCVELGGSAVVAGNESLLASRDRAALIKRVKIRGDLEGGDGRR